jgi:hypothetical protein
MNAEQTDYAEIADHLVQHVGVEILAGVIIAKFGLLR